MKKTIVASFLTVIYCAPATFAQPASGSPFDGGKLEPIKVAYDTHISSADSSQPDRMISSTLTLERSELDGRAVWRLEAQGGAHDLDFWDRATLEAIKRTTTYGENKIILNHGSGGVRVSVEGDNPESYTVPSSHRVVSDGMLNYFALGTLPLKVGFTSSYDSFVRRKKAILTHQLEVVGEATVEVPAGRFDTFVVTERTDEPASMPARTTWYVMKGAPRLVVKLDAVLQNGGTATVALADISR